MKYGRARRPVVGVMGGNHVPDHALQAARELGRAVAQADWVLLTGGGQDGIMGAVAAGARERGGTVIGIRPTAVRDDQESPDLDLVVRTGMGQARNVVNVLSSDVVVALAGGPGTLSEVALACKHGKPTVLLGLDDRGLFGDAVRRCDDVEDSVAAIRAALQGSGAVGRDGPDTSQQP